MNEVLERFKKLGIDVVISTKDDIDAIKAATCIEDAIDAIARAGFDKDETFCTLISAVNEPGDDKPEWFLPNFAT